MKEDEEGAGTGLGWCLCSVLIHGVGVAYFAGDMGGCRGGEGWRELPSGTAVVRMTMHPLLLTMPGRSTSGFRRPGRQYLHQARSTVRCSSSRTIGDLRPQPICEADFGT